MNRKSMWDTLDKLEGRKDSSHARLQKERVRQGYKPEAGARNKAIQAKKKEKVGKNHWTKVFPHAKDNFFPKD